MALLDSFVVYEGIRKAFFLGLRVGPIRRALNLQKGEKLLDAGCGYGFFAQYCTDADYTGIDCDSDRIQQAKKLREKFPQEKYLVSSAAQTAFESKSFDKVICYGLLHHIDDETARLCLRELSRISRGPIVFSDPVYTRHHFINNILCRLDSGQYVRNADEYQKLVGEELAISNSRFFYARNLLAQYFLITALPRS